MKKETIDILGASPSALSMIFELTKNQYRDQSVSLRIIKNSNMPSDLPFAVDGISFDVTSIEDITVLNEKVFLGVYKSQTKKIVYEVFSKKYNLFNQEMLNLVHDQAAVAATVKMGKGIQVNPMTALAPYAQIGDFVSINRNASVGHHSKIGSFSCLNPNVHVAGHCEIEDGVTLGMGALVLDGKKVGKNSIVAAGSLVTKDVPADVMVMGSPAKVIKAL